MSVYNYLRRYKWDLGISIHLPDVQYSNNDWDFHIIKAPHNKWYADPFILDVIGNRLFLLVEEYSYSLKRGRIAKLEIDLNTFKIVNSTILLDLNSHLSFPFIIRNNNRIFLCPENSASGKCILYEYDILTESISPIKCLLSEPVTDVVFWENNGKCFLMATKLPHQNGNCLLVYSCERWDGDYSFDSSIVFPDNSARSAGGIFLENGIVVRPAQICNNGYGEGLVFQQIEIKNGSLVITELNRVFPPIGYRGMHTYNRYKGVTVVDLHKRRYPKLYGVVKKMYSIYRKFYVKK